MTQGKRAAVARWLGTTWRAWRMMKPSRDVEEERIRRPRGKWPMGEQLLEVLPMSEEESRQRHEALE